MRPRWDERDVPVFRRWLVAKLADSKWIARSDEPLETVAVRLGVLPATLSEAKALHDARRRRIGVPAAVLGRPRLLATTVELEVAFPESIWRDWQAYAALRDLPPTTILRSVLWTVLMRRVRPAQLGRSWRYRGRTVRLDGYIHYRRQRKKWPWITKATVPAGAHRALVRRAAEYRCTVTALARGALIELLEGRLREIEIVTGADQMYDDEARYEGASG